MKPVSRRFFPIATTALMLVLCIGIVSLWVRSYRVAEAWVPIQSPASMGAANYRGGLFVILGNGSDEIVTYQKIPAAVAFLDWPAPSWSFAGVGSYPHDFGRLFRLPHYLLLMPMLLRLAWPLTLRFRRTVGLCSICGYDLRATPDRCPECGTRKPAGVAA